MDTLGGLRSRWSVGVLVFCSSLTDRRLIPALMEYHSSDDKAIPGRIFEKGLELFGDEIDFVQRYLGFLISINDINSKRWIFPFR